MRNIRQHIITFSPDHIKHCWNVYEKKYKEIESQLQNTPIDPYYSPYVHRTGAFQIDSSIREFKNSNLYKFFITGATSSYAVKENELYVLRGVMYYPDFLPLSQDARFKNLAVSLKKIYRLISDVDIIRDNHILYLASLDYIKNYLLIILHTLHLLQYRDMKILEGLAENEYQQYLYTVYQVEKQFVESFETKSIVKGYLPAKLPMIITKVMNLIRSILEKTYLSNTEHINLLRSYRENNNPIKLAAFGRALSKEYLTNTLIIGIEYGGIELPLAINAYREHASKSPLDFLILNLSTYSESNVNSAESIYDLFSLHIRNPQLSQYKDVLLVDDSITTGRTISIVNSLLPSNIQRLYFATISMTLSNRFHHLTRKEHGGLNPYVMDSIISIYNLLTRDLHQSIRGI